MASPAVSAMISRSLSAIRRQKVKSEEPDVSTVNWKFLLAVGISIFTYLLLGGLLFQQLEQPNESSDQDGIKAAVNRFLAENPSISSRELNILLALVSKAFSSGFSLGPNGTMTAPPSKWDYSGSVFFCITVITTIGYGNLSPTTVAGQSVLCVYALIGIPMLTVFLTGISERLKALQLRLNRLSCWRGRGRLPVAVTTVLYSLSGLVVFFIVPATIFIFTEGWSFGVGMYYSLVTLSTIGFGDYVAGQTYSSDGYRFGLTLWVFIGMVFVSGLIQTVQAIMEKGSQAVQDTGAVAFQAVKKGAAKIVKTTEKTESKSDEKRQSRE